MNWKANYSLQAVRGDVFGALTAAVVALPLSLAFGVASGLGAIAGLYGAVAVGFFAAVFGGTKTMISGPSAPLSVAMSVVVANHAESLTEALTIAMLAGLVQVVLGLLKVGSFVAYTPHPVISGFMTAVGVIIILVQAIPFMGSPVVLGGPIDSVSALPDALSHIDPSAFALAVITIAVISTWPDRLKKFLPPSVAALIVGTLLGVLWLGDAPTIGEVPTGLPDFAMPEISVDVLTSALQPALTIALIGSINSLLTALIADSMTRENHDPNRELIGVGLGNVFVSLFGGLIGAGATSVTVANVRAGGRSRIAGVLCATIILALLLGLGRYVGSIPHAVLAGILCRIGFDIIDWRYITRIRRIPREHYTVMAMTLGLAVVSDLVTAVVIGLIASAMAGARQSERLELGSVISTPLLDMTFLGASPAAGTEPPEAPEEPASSAEGSDQSTNEPDEIDMLDALDESDPLDAMLDALDESDPLDAMLNALDESDGMDMFSARTGLLKLRGSFTVASSKRLVTTIGHDVAEHEVVIFDFSETVHMDDSAALVVEQLIDVAQEQNTECIVMGVQLMPDTSLQALDVLRKVPEHHMVETLDDAREVARQLLARIP